MSNLNGGLSGSGLLKGALGGGGAPSQDVYWDDILDKPEFAEVATSGSYNDLTDKPTIPAAQVNADWNATSGVAEILNKPTLADVATSGSYNDLTDTPTIPAAQVNADWNATSGVAEILNKPTIPAAQVNADWNATSGVAEILNKPTIPTTAAQIDYDNTTSGLTATDTQEAIDENAAEITTIKSNLTELETIYTASFVAGTYTSNGKKISTDLVLPAGKYEVTIGLPYCNTALDKLYGLENGSIVVPQSYSAFLMGLKNTFILDVVTDTTYWISLQSSGISITLSNIDRGQIVARKIQA